MGDLGDRVRKLSPEKRRLLEQRLKARRPPSTIAVAPDAEGPFPLSFAQERFWFLEQLEPGDPSHHVPGTSRLRGRLDTEALRRAVQTVVDRHAMLRTTFRVVDGRPVQVVRARVPVELEPLDLRGLPAVERASERVRRLDRAVATPFDLEQGPLLRLDLLRLADDEWELISCVHHIVADGLSAQMFGREMAEAYRATVQGDAPRLPRLQLQYKDFAVWQREHLDDAALAPGVAWWTERLRDLPVLELPADRPRRDDWSARGGRETRPLPNDLVQRVRSLAREAGVTPFTVLLAVFQAWLGRVTRSSDVVVGTPVANRERAELEPLIGFFVNSLVLRVDTEDDPPFRDFLQRSRRCVLSALDHQAVPFEKIVDALQPERHLDRNPLFQVMFNYVDFPAHHLEMPGVTLEYAGAQAGTLLDLTLYATVRGEGLDLAFEYDKGLFDAATVRRFLAQLQLLIEVAVGDPGTRLSELDLVTADERRLLRQWGRGARSDQANWPPVDRRIARHAARTPDAIAVRGDGTTLTYRDLDARANGLAHRLRMGGIGPGHRVGLCLDRTPDLLVALLGILKTGAAYVPLDPAFPRARLLAMAADAELAAAVCDATGEALLTRDLACVRVGDQTAATAPDVAEDPERPAYVIYTSGSTGRPKGVVVPHRALSNLLQSMAREPGLREDDILLAVTTLSFDIAALELLGPLTVAGTVRLASAASAADGYALRSLLEEEPITVMQATPASWRMLCHAGWQGDPRLRILCGGEGLPPDLADELLARGAEVWNLYGPTETAIWSTAARLTPGPVTIGRPIRETVVEVVDENGRPVPVNVAGELLIGGAGVALGYHRRPELDAERFVHGAFRTGDLARFRGDGRLEHLGRLDRQLKVRGFRIEPAEVEAELRRHSAIADAAVDFASDTLCAWIVPRHEIGPGESSESAVQRWAEVWDATYREGVAEHADFDTRGWIDGRTGGPVPEDHMAEWVDTTVARIRSLDPRRVLEIGCGTGLLLWRLAPDCAVWTATEVAPAALAAVRCEAEARGLDQVKVFERPAHALGELPGAPFDTIVLNSVVQYFPDVDYLLTVLASALTQLSPGGRVFLGDLRSLRQSESPDDDEELLVDNALFERLAAQWDLHARVELRSGRADSEMNRHRYDVVLTLAAPREAAVLAAVDWSEEKGELAGLGRRLADESSGIRVRGIPNARLVAPGGIEPDDLWQLGNSLGFSTEVTWGAEPDRVDAAFRRTPAELVPRGLGDPLPPFDGSSYANDPGRAERARRLAAKLGDHLRERLPDYMVPSRFLVVSRLPLTASGKVDRKALPPPVPVPRRHGRRPATDMERRVAGFYGELLGIDEVGAYDDFFDLGGHSLLATRLAARVRNDLGLDMPLRAFFAAPTVAALAVVLESAVPRSGRPTAPIEPAPRTGHLPLSFAQERLWFLHQLQPESSAYNMAGALRLVGALDESALERSLCEIVRRHEVLRTAFRSVGGRAVQEAGEPPSSLLRREDLSLLADDERAGALRERLAAEGGRPFDLESPPLVRACLFRLGSREHVLSITLHHIAGDGWSLAVAVRELCALYRAFRAGEPSPLPEPRLQYADFAVWQRERMRGSELDRQLAFWREHLAGAAPVTGLPADRPRPRVQAHRGASRRFRLSPSTGEALRRIADNRRTTLFATLLAGFAAFLQRMTGNDDLVVGTTVANRNHLDTEGLVGCIVNSLPLRVVVGPGQKFADLVDHVRTTVLTALDHQDLPFEKLVEALDPPRDTSRQPLFQVAFDMTNQPTEELRLPGLIVAPEPVPNRTSKFDLTVRVAERDGLDFELEWDTDLYDAETVDGWWSCYESLLTAAAEDPETAVGSLRVLSSAERDRLLFEWSGTDSVAEHAPILDRIARVVAERGAAAAVVSGDEVLSLAGLWERADGVAGRLRAEGVTRGALVAVCLPPGPDLLAALLGVWRAGAAYLPIDPGDPEPRRRLLLEDSCAAPLLDEAWLAENRGASTDVGRIEVGADDLAYVMYTSGSTGTPKGVAVTHGNLAHYLAWAVEFYRLADGDGAPLHSSPAFDLTVTSLFAPLLVGRAVHVLPGGGPDALAATAERSEPFALVKLTPSHLETLQAPVPANVLVVGGEALTYEALRPWRERDTRIVNEYGPTEATVGCIVHEVGSEDPVRGPVPVGRPIPGARAYVLDACLEPVPVGALGELHLGGAGLARGYWRQERLTAERFLADPFRPGERIYRTGDLARWRPDGVLEFVGRADDQVKVRGHRVELGEVEAALRRHPLVREAVAGTRELGGARQLVAWCVLDRGAEGEDVRATLAAELPTFLVPAVCIAVDALPLTSSGKVDRAALPDPRRRDVASPDYAVPIGDAEQALARVWADVLGLELVGRDDNFFGLGGDSILAIQVVSGAAAAQLHLTPQHVFQHQTLAELAAVAGRQAEGRADQEPVVGSVPLTPIQRWLFARRLEDPGHYHQALLLSWRAGTGPTHVKAALDELATHHDMLRCRFEREGTDWRADVTPPPGEVAWSEHGSDEDVGAVVAEHRPALDRLLVAAWIAEGDGLAPRLLLLAHHLVVDGVSWRIVLDDLQTAYRQSVSGESVRLPARTDSFRTWAERLADTTRFAAQRDCWRGLAAVETALPFDEPGDRPGGAQRTSTEVDAATTATLQGDANTAWRTRGHELLVTALALAVSDWAGTSRVRLDLEGHGRSLSGGPDTSRTVGWFTAIHPVVIDLPSKGDVDGAIRVVKESLRAVPDGGLGYGALGFLEADAARLGGILFNFLGDLDRQHPGPEVGTVELVTGGLRARGNRPSHALEIDAFVREGRLQVRWSYGGDAFRTETVGSLARLFSEHACRIASRCVEEGAGGSTPSDFPLADLRQEELDRLVEAYPDLEDAYTPTPTQLGMYFHGLHTPESTAYFEQLANTFEGRLDFAALREAFRLVCSRHELFRAAITREGLRAPLLVVLRGIDAPWREVDLGDLPEAGRLTALRALAADDRALGFDLSQPPLFRLTLARFAEDRHALLFSYHHLILDGWSMPLLLRELLVAYEALARGEAPVLASAPRYRDYAEWLAGQDLDAARQFWVPYLRGFGSATPVGLHPGRSRVPEYGEVELLVPADATATLRELGRSCGVTASLLVQAAWGLVLGRYAEQDDVVFGVTVAGRPTALADVTQRIGLFINTVPVRVRLPSLERVQDWLQDLQQAWARLQAHEHTPLPVSQSCSEVPPGAPLFESLLVFENYPLDDALRVPPEGMRVVDTWSYERTSYPLTVVAVPGERLLLRLLFDRERLSEPEAEAMLGHLAGALDAFATEPLQPLAQVGLAGEEECGRLLGWSGSAATSVEPTVPVTVALRAGEAPEAHAIDSSGEVLAYRELDERAVQLARRLVHSGAGRERLVAVALPRGIDQVVALLAVWKAGSAYLPVDTDHPRARLEAMYAESQPVLTLTRRDLTSALPDSTRSVFLDEEEREDPDGVDLPPAPSPDDLAYVLFTSGSTGRPKGIAVEHRSLAHYLARAREVFALGPADRVLQFASLGFDTSAEEIWGALTAGATLVLRAPGALPSIPAFLDRIRQERITVLDLPTSFWHELVDALEDFDSAFPDSVRLVVLGGEAVDPRRLRRWRDHFGPQTRLLNTYGPTEATIVATVHDLTADRGTPVPEPVPIGTPLRGVTALVLDSQGRLAPQGLAGELCLGGAGLARGYLDAAQTRAAFVPHPYLEGERIYRTGDRARWGCNGVLEFLGRLDQQVKIRGQRLELEEVESVLQELPEVAAAAAAVRGDPPTLVAWVQPANLGSVNPDALRDHARRRLPTAHVPVRFEVVEALATTPSGKLDRAALTGTGVATSADTSPAAPRSQLETELAAVLGEVLGVRAVGIHDDFFALGGDSLAAVRLLTRVRTAFGAELPLRALFDGPTVAEMATALAHALSGDEAPTRSVDLHAEATLPEDFEAKPSATEPHDPPRAVLVTGGTGFLGVHLVRELLEQTAAEIVCVVRAPDADAGLQRLRERLASLGVSDPSHLDRVRALPGRLDAPRFGWETEAWNRVAGSVDRIVHCGARTHALHPYRALAPVNVGGTVEILRLACQGGGLPVHHVSTVGVFDTRGSVPVEIAEDTDLDAFTELPNGYAQTKWVAETLAHRARERGVPVTVYRPGRLVGTARGLDRDDLTAMLLRASVEIGMLPEVGGPVDLTPVDWAARALVRISGLPRREAVYHLVHPEPPDTRRIVDALGAYGYSLVPVPYDRWRRELLLRFGHSPRHPAYPALSLLAGANAPLRAPRFRCSRTTAALAGTAIHCPPFGIESLEPALDAWVATCRLPAPAVDPPTAPTAR